MKIHTEIWIKKPEKGHIKKELIPVFYEFFEKIKNNQNYLKNPKRYLINYRLRNLERYINGEQSKLESLE